MTRSELEHLIRAACEIAGDQQLIVIGSQSVLGAFPEAPRSLRMSMEADVYPKNHPAMADAIDGAIGEGSSFHQTFGYYAQGVGPDTATLPAGWEARLVSIRNANTRGYEGLCLDVHDLAIAKYVAGRDKDLRFTRELARCGLTRKRVLQELLAETEVAPSLRKIIAARIGADFQARGRPRGRR